jgi:valyl-tRNA synthetase
VFSVVNIFLILGDTIMSLAKTYNPQELEPRIQAFWQEQGIYNYDPASEAPVYSIDTPPPTASGNLHLGHLYSYSHPDFIARFWRMNGWNVFYPMGFDDNGLPTERLVEKRLGLHAREIGRTAFIQKCLELSRDVEQEYQAIWQRLGLSIDWRYIYRTIDDRSRRLCQLSFITLYRRGLVYRREAPAIWCPECQASFAQADLNDLDRSSEFVTLAFALPEGDSSEAIPSLPIATTRPELLPACVAVFVHPNDPRYQHLIAGNGKAPRSAIVPIFGQAVPILADPAADPQKGTGAVMCCTFGDTTDISWWNTHRLPVIQAIDRTGRMTSAAGAYAGLPLAAARQQIKETLAARGLILARQPTTQSVRVHERCDTPVEYLLVQQWFLRLLDFKRELLQAGEAIRWHPASMHARYQDWVENLNWDWCLSRQRFYGPVIPAWYCQACGETILADEDQLPVDPTEQEPSHPCPKCGGTAFIPEQDVFDTWATSALTPQIVGQAEFTISNSNVIARQCSSAEAISTQPGNRISSLAETTNGLYGQVFPYSLRPQAHDIIRTWAFYTIVQSLFHWDALPWKNVLISGWGIAGEGMGKISKSRGGGPMAPLDMIARYSADAVRYWAASTAPGKDAIISEEKIQMGARLATKLWNVARFSERFLSANLDVMVTVGAGSETTPTTQISPADRWILSRTQKLVRRTTSLLQEYDYAAAKSEIESFFWTELADNYLEMAKQRLYDPTDPSHEAARFSLQTVLLTVLKLFAPFLPYVTEAIYQGLGEQGAGDKGTGKQRSIHRENWPVADPALENDAAEAVGLTLVAIATAARRFKSERNLPLGAELNRVQLAAVESDGTLMPALQEAVADLKSITRARKIVLGSAPDEEAEYARLEGLRIFIQVE